MIRQCFLANTGIMFLADRLQDAGLEPDSLWPEVKKRPPPLEPTEGMKVRDKREEVVLAKASEEEHELHDVLSPIYDQLHISHPWWILEVLPMRQRRQLPAPSADWESWIAWNLGRPRVVPNSEWFGSDVEGGDGGGEGGGIGLGKRERVKVHRSVKTRMAVGYKPRATFVDPIWVD
jgi:hypothetical protein